MSNNHIPISLVSMDCETAIGDEKDTAEMLKKAFKAARNHWMVLEDTPQLQGALNAVLTKLGKDHPDYQRLMDEISMIGKVNAWIHASQIGVAGDFPTMPDDYKAIGVMQFWRESKQP